MYKTLSEFLKQKGPTVDAICGDGALRNPNSFPLYGRRIFGAILFADLPGYSKLSESRPPEECAYITNQYFSWMEAEGINKYNGIIDKFIGDEIMVVFSSEINSNNPWEAALNTAKSMITRDNLSFYPKIGIAYGEIFVCYVGSVDRYDVSAVGHAVNLASRCVFSLQKGKSIKVASDDRNKVSNVFSESKDWHIIGPRKESFKNISPTSVIQIDCKFDTHLNFDYLEYVRKEVQSALSEKKK